MLSIYQADINQVIMVTVIAKPAHRKTVLVCVSSHIVERFFYHKPSYRVIGCNKRKFLNSQFQIINLACFEVVPWILNVVYPIITST